MSQGQDPDVEPSHPILNWVGVAKSIGRCPVTLSPPIQNLYSYLYSLIIILDYTFCFINMLEFISAYDAISMNIPHHTHIKYILYTLHQYNNH